MFKQRLWRGEGVLHHCIEGERVGDNSSKIVDVDRRHDPSPDGVLAPPGEREESPLLLLLPWPPPRWEDSSPSGPWPPWRRRGGSPSEIGSPSLFSSVSRSPRSGRKTFLIFREIRNSYCVAIITRFSPEYKLPCARSRAPTDVRGKHNPPPCARLLGRALVSCGLCGPPFALIPSPKKDIYSKIILHKIYCIQTSFDMDIP